MTTDPEAGFGYNEPSDILFYSTGAADEHGSEDGRKHKKHKGKKSKKVPRNQEPPSRSLTPDPYPLADVLGAPEVV